MPETKLSDLPDHATVYVPGFGETTLGAIRQSAPDPMRDTVSMWGYIATHPDWRPWKTGRATHGS